MYLDPWAAVALFLLAAVGTLALVTSVGVWIFTSGLPEGSVDDAPAAPTGAPASESLGRITSNVRVLPPPQAVKGAAPGSGSVPTTPPPPHAAIRDALRDMTAIAARMKGDAS